MDLTNDFMCQCSNDFTGKTCNVSVDRCSSHPCHVNATCQADHLTGYKCACAEGFTGKHCDIAVSSCASNLCRNNATCVDWLVSVLSVDFVCCLLLLLLFVVFLLI